MCVPVWMLQVMVVLRTPSCSRVVSGSKSGRGCPGTGMVFSENGMVRSMILLIRAPLVARSTPSALCYIASAATRKCGACELTPTGDKGDKARNQLHLG